MKGLKRDSRKIWVSLYSSKDKVMQSSGTSAKWTGEWKVVRSEPFPIYASITAGRSQSKLSPFGVDVSHDRVVTIDHVSTGITETSVLWVDSEPTFDQNGNLVVDANGNPAVPYDYVVTGVAESINVTSLAISKVKVS